MTKTHCGGFSQDSTLNELVLWNTSDFMTTCLSSESLNARNQLTVTAYDSSYVRAAVHLVRDPFDNIVSRFHHERKGANFTDADRQLYPKSRDGFRAFCVDKVDEQETTSSLTALTGLFPSESGASSSQEQEQLLEAVQHIPCHVDFVRYILWHNHAFQGIQEYGWESLILHYEKYGIHWNRTVTELLEFLQLDAAGDTEPEQFRAGKMYRRSYTKAEVATIEALAKVIATNETWANIWHYFDDDEPIRRTMNGEAGVPPCTLESLRTKVANINTKTNDDPSTLSNVDGDAHHKKETTTCWNFKENFLRIPQTLFVSSSGQTNTVYDDDAPSSDAVVTTGYIRLDDYGDICTVQVKPQKSCAADFPLCSSNATVNNDDLVSFATDYLGAMVFMALDEMEDVQVPGAAVTPWGGVYAASSSSNTQSQERMLGVIYPFAVDGEPQNRNQETPPSFLTTQDAVRLMLSVLESRTFLNSLKEGGLDNRFKTPSQPCVTDGLFHDDFLTCLETFVSSSTECSGGEVLIVMIWWWLQIETTRMEPALRNTLDEIFYDPHGYYSIHDVAHVLRSFLSEHYQTILPFRFAPESGGVDDPLQQQRYPNDSNNNQAIQAFLAKSALLAANPEFKDVFFDPEDGSWMALVLTTTETQTTTTAADTTSRSTRLELKLFANNSSDGRPWSDAAAQTTTTSTQTILLDLLSDDDVGQLSSPSLYVAPNGTITVLLDTCNTTTSTLLNEQQQDGGTPQKGCFSLIQARGGCNLEHGCDEWKFVGTKNFLQVPMHCSREQEDDRYACPCNVKDPVLWFDGEAQKWRILMTQSSSTLVNGQCMPLPYSDEYVGGYAETSGASLGGPWRYDYFQPAYSNVVRLDTHGERAFKTQTLTRREKPAVILNERSGGLDNGFLVNYVVVAGDCVGERKDECEYNTPIFQRVSQSLSTPELRSSGTIYLLTHGDPSEKVSPRGLGPVGQKHAEYIASVFNGTKYKAPSTIIACQIVDDEVPPAGQRMQETVQPLAEAIGIPLLVGPTFVDEPGWTSDADVEAAKLALASLKNGTVAIAMWSFVEEFCYQLGTTCKNLDHGEFVAIEIMDGVPVRATEATDGYIYNYIWEDLPETITNALSLLGYNQEIWDEGEEDPIEGKEWSTLTPEVKEAAMLLGFNKMKWESTEFMDLDISNFH